MDSPQTRWNEKFAELEALFNSQGRLPRRAGSENPLALWLRYQRKCHRANSLTPSRLKALKRIPGALTEKKPVSFEVKLDSLREYIERTGQLPPLSTKSEDTAVVSKFYAYMRSWGPGLAREDAIARYRRFLDVVETAPSAGTPMSSSSMWSLMLERVEDSCRRTGYRPVAGSKIASTRQLGQWLKNQDRRLAEGRLTKLDDISLARLQHVLNYPSFEQHEWNLWAQDIANHVRLHGALPHWSDKVAYEWVGRQRARHRNGRLTEAQVETLRLIPGILATDAVVTPMRRAS